MDPEQSVGLASEIANAVEQFGSAHERRPATVARGASRYGPRARFSCVESSHGRRFEQFGHGSSGRRQGNGARAAIEWLPGPRNVGVSEKATRAKQRSVANAVDLETALAL